MTITLTFPHWLWHVAYFTVGLLIGAGVGQWIAKVLVGRAIGRSFGW